MTSSTRWRWTKDRLRAALEWGRSASERYRSPFPLGEAAGASMHGRDATARIDVTSGAEARDHGARSPLRRERDASRGCTCADREVLHANLRGVRAVRIGKCVEHRCSCAARGAG